MTSTTFARTECEHTMVRGNPLVIIHRINKVSELEKIPEKYGIEIDVRGYGSTLLLSHEPISDPASCDDLESFLRHCRRRFIVFDVKEAGYEERILGLARRFGIDDYFLLDVEFPYLYRATRNGHVRNIAVRYSEAEPIENAEAQVIGGKPLLDWVWIDTNTCLPLTPEIARRLSPFKTCLVCPERWGRPKDIPVYIGQMRTLPCRLDAVMTSLPYAEIWERSGVLK